MTDEQLLALARSGGDCTAELQARIESFRPHGGVVNLPNGGASFRVPGGLVLGGNPEPHGQGPPTSFRGCPGASTLAYDGDPNTVAFRVDRVWGYNLNGFGVYRTPSDRQGIGIHCSPNPDTIGVPGVGTVSGTALWQQVVTRYFAIGALLGSLDGQWATSEIEFDSCVFGNCDVGIRIESFNTLDFVFNMLNMSGNRVGLLAGSGGVVVVNGGASSGNEDFDFLHQHAHPIHITGYRTEHCNCFYGGTSTVAPTHATIDSCIIIQRSNPTKPAISAGWGCELIVRNSTIGNGDGLGDPTTSGILYNNNSGHGSVILENCGIESPTPITVVSHAADTPPIKLIIRNCWRIQGGNNPIGRFPDFDGLVTRYPLPAPTVAVVNDSDAGYSAPGWMHASGSGFAEYYNSDTGYRNDGTAGVGPATWTSPTLTAGTYRVSATWTGHPGRATNAAYVVKSGATVLLTATVSQKATPTDRQVSGSWFKDLGTVTLPADGPLTVELSGQGNGALIADAVRFEKL